MNREDVAVAIAFAIIFLSICISIIVGTLYYTKKDIRRIELEKYKIEMNVYGEPLQNEEE